MFKTAKNDTKHKIPAYKYIYSDLLKNIEQSTNNTLSVNKIARKYNVNRNTADKAINLLAEKGWVRRIIGKGTFPITRSQQKTYDIQIIYSHQIFKHLYLEQIPFVHSKLLEAMLCSRFAEKCDIKLKIMTLDNSYQQREEERKAELMSMGKNSGVIVFNPEGCMEDIIDTLQECSIPYMTYAPVSKNYNHASENSYEATSQAIEYLIRMSHRKKIVFLCNSKENVWQRTRLDAYRDALAKNGLQFDEQLVWEYPALSDDAMKEVAMRLQNSCNADAIFAASFIWGQKVNQIMKILDIKIPEQIAVIAMHDVPVFSQCTPAISAIRVPLEKIAEKMLETLIGMIDTGAREGIRIIEKSQLVIRSST